MHGQRFELAAGADQRRPDQLLAVRDTSRYGRVEVRAWHGMHQKVQRTGYFARLEAELFTRLPVIEGTIIEVRVERLPDGRSPHRTMWLWHSGPHAPDLYVCWRAYLRRFDMEHTFKLMKSQLGWTAARVRHPEQAVRWTWLLIAAYVQLRLARDPPRCKAQDDEMAQGTPVATQPASGAAACSSGTRQFTPVVSRDVSTLCCAGRPSPGTSGDGLRLSAIACVS